MQMKLFNMQLLVRIFKEEKKKTGSKQDLIMKAMFFVVVYSL